MSAEPGDHDRIHNEAPSEGDRSADTDDIRVHPEEPAEGADPDASDDQDGSGS